MKLNPNTMHEFDRCNLRYLDCNNLANNAVEDLLRCDPPHSSGLAPWGSEEVARNSGLGTGGIAVLDLCPALL